MSKYVLEELVTAQSQAAMLSTAFVIPATLWRSFSQLFVHTLYISLSAFLLLIYNTNNGTKKDIITLYFNERRDRMGEWMIENVK